MYGYNGYMNAPALQMPQGNPFSQMSYMQMQGAQQPMQQVQQMPQPGMIQARYVTGREEAVAAQILPDGNIYIFADTANGRMYTKQVNPQTNSAEFVTYVRETPMPQETPQYPTMEMFMALQQRVEQLSQPSNRRKGADAE